MAELATGYVQIIPSMKGAPQTIRNELTGASETAGAKSGSVFGSTMKKYISAAAIGTALTKSLTEGAALEQALGGVETLYKKHAQTVIDYADNAWETAGISANQYMEQSTSFAAALLNSLGGDTKKAAEAANTAITDMADNANKMGTPLEAIQNAYQGMAKQNYTMLDNLKLGYGGTKTEMERLLADAEEFSGVHYDISNLSDVYEAIHVIQNELDITGTTAKEGATTLSGSFMAMKASAENLLGNLALGRNVGKSMQGLVKSVGTFLSKNLIPAIGNVIKSIPTLFTSINWVKVTSALGKQTSKFVDQALKWAEGLAKGIAKGMPKFIEQLPKFINNLANIVNQNAPKILATGVKIVVTLVRGIISAIPTLVRNIPQLTKAAANAFLAYGWGSLGKSAISLLKGGITKAAGSIGSAIRSKLSNVKSAISSPFESAKNAVVGIINKIKGFFPIRVGNILSGLRLPRLKLKTSIAGALKTLATQGVGATLKLFDIKWNAEGGIFNKASIIGYGVGEAGAEAIVPLDTFWNKMDAIANGTRGNAPIYITVQSVLDGEVVAENTVQYINNQVQRFGTSPINI